jgi:glycosyltransferase involved in cell wall biosynthesis
MRLMFVITRGDDLGGAQTHVRDITRRLAADGHQVHVVVGATGSLTEELQSAGIWTSSCPGLLRQVHPVHDLRAVWQLARMIGEFAPDLVTTHSSKAGMVGRLAAKLAGTPCIFTVHGWAYIDTVPQPIRGAYRWMERGCAHLASQVICVSHKVRQMGVDAGIDPRKFVVVPNGLFDVPDGLRATPGLESPRAVMVARFAAPKDHATVLRSLIHVPGLKLDFVGDGPDEEPARRLAGELGVADRVAFLGRRTDVPEILSRSQIFILSSLSEAFPISTLEAMRAGLPVVVSSVGGAGEAVRDGESGYLVERANPKGLAERLGRLAADPALRTNMGAAGRKLFEAEFTFERMYERTLAVYESVLATAALPSPVLET